MKRLMIRTFFAVALSVSLACAKQSLDNIEELIASMSLREKIAQLMIVAAVSNEEEFNREFIRQSVYRMDKNQLEFLIKHCHVGGVIFLGSGIRSQQVARTNYFQKITDIPLLMCADAEFGSGMRLLDGLIFPRNMTLGALADDTLIYEMGKCVGNDLAQMGIHLNFAPVVDVNNNPENPIIYERSFGSNPGMVARKGVAFIKGLQDVGIITCAKHFPGHGDTNTDSHVALPVINHDRIRLDDIELVPFKAAIGNNVDAVMIGHIAMPGIDSLRPASISSVIITDLLKNELGFSGLIITDGLGMYGITAHQKPGILEIQALLAGADILLCPVDVPLAIMAIEEAIKKNIISEENITNKVRRVLQVKKRALENSAMKKDVSSCQIQELKQKLYEQAVTLVFDHRKGNCREFVASITPTSKYARDNFGIFLNQLAQLQEQKDAGNEITIIIYGTPYAVPLLTPYADRLLVAYEETQETKNAVQQILQGTLTPRGILPV